MKKLLVALLSLLAIGGTMSATVRERGETCNRCHKTAHCAPHTHSHSCEPKPVCSKMVRVTEQPCKQCNTVTTCGYQCPRDTVREEGKEEAKEEAAE